MIQSQAQTRTRVENPSRWQAALDRALENALDVYVEPISGEAFVESASHPGTLYAVSRTSCTCPAGLAGDPICQHRACYRAQIGELPLEPMPPVVAIAIHRCSWCGGAGQVERWGVGGPIGSQTCPDCGGNGIAEPLAA